MQSFSYTADSDDVARKVDNARDDLETSTRDELDSSDQRKLTLNHKKKEKSVTDDTTEKMKKIMQTDNASSYHQLIYCQRHVDESRELSRFARYVVIKSRLIS